MRSEFELIEELQKIFGSLKSPNLGIGDDAAILEDMTPPLLWTTDTFREEIHFHWDWLSSRDIGYRMASACLSDIAAMGGDPRYLLVSFHLPSLEKSKSILDVARGIFERAQLEGASVAGGNISKSGTFAVEISALGQTNGKVPLKRSGANPEDRVFVSGYPGLSSLVLHLLQKKDAQVPEEIMQDWKHPPSRCSLGRSLLELASSCIDISDGLALDASHIAKASRVHLALDSRKFPLPEAVKSDGALLDSWRKGRFPPSDDYELLFSIPLEKLAKVENLKETYPITEIGEVLKGEGQVSFGNEAVSPASDQTWGWDHFLK